jgi:hypothetical protein
MSTEIELRQPRPQASAAAIPAKLQYARALADSGLLPAAYRRNPANVLWAVEYGEMLGLPPMAAMTGVHVIEGKPTASAGLISGLVRQAGHKLRVWGTNKSATCEIVRSDDPEHTFSVTWTLRKGPDDNPSAEEAVLLGKSVWKQYPASMLKSRAITQCARDACEEVLYGLHYTPEELGAEVDEDGDVVVAEVVHEPVLTPEQEWLVRALEVAPDHASLDACGAVWARVVEYVNDGKLTKAEGGRLQDALRVRIGELKAAEAAPEAGVAADAELDPDDPWAVAIEGVASAEDAEKLLADLIEQRSLGKIDPERAALIERAIEAEFPTSAEEKAAA